MKHWFESMRAALDRLTSKQKVQLVLAAVATLGVVWGMVAYGTRIRYDVMYSGVDVEAGAEIVDALQQRDVPYRLRRGGKVIEVPKERISELRMELAGEGLPRGGGVGFEIFDKPSFGLSAFVQNVNYRRALERELGRTIQDFDAIESARVHLAIPPETVFAEDQKEASASVVVRLKGGHPLARDRVTAITYLVASGVEELESTRVSVIDSDGRLLTSEIGEDEAGLSPSQNEARQGMERRIESVLIAMLEPVVGQGKVRARATVELETARVERIEERFDPDGVVVRSEQKNKARSGGGRQQGGAPGTDSNLPQGSAAGGAGEPESQTQTSTTNFEINKTVSKIAQPRGGLLRQSVAVVVDNAVTLSEDEEGNSTEETTPRTEEEMDKITALVHAAVGIDEDRGDSLIVENIPFDKTMKPVLETGGGLDWVHLIIETARYLALPLAVLLIALFVIRPGLATLRSLRAPSQDDSAVQTVAELQAQIAQGALPSGAPGSALRNKLIEAATEDPETAALVVRGWLGKAAE